MKKRFLYKSMLITFILIAMIATVLGCTAKQPETPVPDPAPTPVPPEPVPTEQPPVTPPTAGDISQYMPMKVGYIWQYEGDGNEYASYTSRVEYQENNRYQVTKDNGGTVMANIYEVTDDSIIHVYQMGESYDQKNLLNEKENLEEVLIKLPLQVGNKWISEENTYEIIDTKASITVPYGTFDNCLVIKRTYKDGSEEFMYYKEGIGLLQSEFRSGDFKVFSRLKDFSSK
ncbi:MAG: hypothetical protein A2Y23_13560 [Clostridiales bacterium GWB2_37_7]|nr:MAG: hypothetical protein A2Y23_13560 [Clostridiales bacterium GWB2_37_7]